jgi:hypothetical protein
VRTKPSQLLGTLGAMSIPVDLAELGTTLADFPWGYFVTVNDREVAHSLAVRTDFRDGALHLAAGRGTRANAQERPFVSMVFPGADGHAYSLIVDGRAEVVGEAIVFTPASAVLHRPALS